MIADLTGATGEVTQPDDPAVPLTVPVPAPVAAWLRALALRLGMPGGPGEAAAGTLTAAYAHAYVTASGLTGGVTWGDAGEAALAPLSAAGETGRIRDWVGVDPLAAPAGMPLGGGRARRSDDTRPRCGQPGLVDALCPVDRGAARPTAPRHNPRPACARVNYPALKGGLAG